MFAKVYGIKTLVMSNESKEVNLLEAKYARSILLNR